MIFRFSICPVRQANKCRREEAASILAAPDLSAVQLNAYSPLCTCAAHGDDGRSLELRRVACQPRNIQCLGTLRETPLVRLY